MPLKHAKVRENIEGGAARGYYGTYGIRREDPPANFENDLAATAIF